MFCNCLLSHKHVDKRNVVACMTMCVALSESDVASKVLKKKVMLI